MRTLIAIPVYNEERYVAGVLRRVLREGHDVLVVNDGSTDGTAEALRGFPVSVITNGRNVGYGRAIRAAFEHAQTGGYDWVVTMDCDEQHEPAAIPRFLGAAATGEWDIVSGSRYLAPAPEDDAPPRDRRAINAEITGELDRRLGGLLFGAGERMTDAFCGFKAHRVSSLARLLLTEDGYAFPMQLWVQAAAAGLRATEIRVRLIYNDPSRSFGGPLDDPGVRLAHYRRVLHCELKRCAHRLPPGALDDVHVCCCC